MALARAAVLAVLLTVVTAVPARAATFPVTVSPPGVHPTESFTVSGTAPCADRGYTVTLSYENAAGTIGTVTESGMTDAEGDFSQAVVAPEDADGNESADVSVSVACDEVATSDPATVVIASWQEQLDVSTVSGQAGDIVHVAGEGCYGGSVEVVFLESEGDPAFPVPMTLTERSFEGEYTIPDVPPGDYGFTATCPGTDYEFAPFGVYEIEDPPLTVDGPPMPETPGAEPADPVPGAVTVTG